MNSTNNNNNNYKNSAYAAATSGVATSAAAATGAATAKVHAEPSICIPRVFQNIDEKRLRRIFGQLSLGVIHQIDIIEHSNEKGDKFNRVFIHFESWASEPEALTARTRLIEGKKIKIVYDDPWFWEISAYRKKEPSPKPVPKQVPVKKPFIQARMVFEDNSESDKNRKAADTFLQEQPESDANSNASSRRQSDSRSDRRQSDSRSDRRQSDRRSDSRSDRRYDDSRSDRRYDDSRSDRRQSDRIQSDSRSDRIQSDSRSDRRYDDSRSDRRYDDSRSDIRYDDRRQSDRSDSRSDDNYNSRRQTDEYGRENNRRLTSESRSESESHIVLHTVLPPASIIAPALINPASITALPASNKRTPNPVKEKRVINSKKPNASEITFTPNQFVEPITVIVPKEKENYKITTEELNIRVNESRRTSESMRFELIDEEEVITNYGIFVEPPKRRKAKILKEETEEK